MMIAPLPVCSIFIQLSVPVDTHANMKANVIVPVTIIINSNLPAILSWKKETVNKKSPRRTLCLQVHGSPKGSLQNEDVKLILSFFTMIINWQPTFTVLHYPLSKRWTKAFLQGRSNLNLLMNFQNSVGCLKSCGTFVVEPRLWLSHSSSQLHIPGESEKNVGRLADCDITLNHPIIVKYNFTRSQESNLDHKPFSVQIGHLMQFYKHIFFVRPYMGSLQTGGIFFQAPSISYGGKRYRYMWYSQGRMKSLQDGIFSFGM